MDSIKHNLNRKLSYPFGMKAFFMSLMLVATVTCFAQIDRAFDLENFDGLDVSGPYSVTLEKGTPRVELSGDEDVIDNTTVRIEGGTLVIKFENNSWRWGNSDRVDVMIYFDRLKDMEISGACELFARSIITSSDFDLDVSGASRVEFEIETGRMDMEISGASTVELFGSATDMSIELSGASTLRAEDLKAESCDIDGSGASNANIHVTDRLRADASGATSIRYYGNPKYVNADSSGAGSVRSRGR